MKIWVRSIAPLVVLAGLAAPAQPQMTPAALEALQRPIAIEREGALATIPLRRHMSKLALDASLNGVERQFIFDTGSPTMISRELAAQLELTPIGSNTGRDANGAAVTTEIAIVERLELGTMVFRQVPVLIADFKATDPQGCFFDGGVIGSEIMPGSAWQIDTQRMEMRVAPSAGELQRFVTSDGMVDAPLETFGYPHAPIVPYAIGDLKDRALFDTGNSASVTLFNRVMGNTAVKRAIVPGSLRKGRGSLGVSAAGLGEETDLLRFEIEGMRVGEDRLGRQTATIRTAPPSLMGLGILDTHIVTLDYPGERLRLHPRTNTEPRPQPPGYGLMAIDGAVQVVQLYDGSKARKAGLKLGDRVVAMDDRAIGAVSCETMRWLIEDRPAQSAKRITVLRDSARVEIDLSGG